MEDERDQKNFGVIMEIMTVNIDQHYFHNVYLRFAQTHIMKIMLINIHGTIPHNVADGSAFPCQLFSKYFGEHYFHNEHQNIGKTLHFHVIIPQKY